MFADIYIILFLLDCLPIIYLYVNLSLQLYLHISFILKLAEGSRYRGIQYCWLWKEPVWRWFEKEEDKW